MPRSTTALALFVAAALGAAPAAAQLAANASVNPEEARSYEFHVDWGPLKLAEVTFRYEERDGRMELTGFAESVGLGAMVLDFETEQRVLYEDDRRVYESFGKWKNDSARRVVSWNGADEPVLELMESTEEKPDVLTPIPEGELKDTVDPAFPIVDLLKRMQAGESCEGSYRIFDGVRRMDVAIVEEGVDWLTADRDWTFGGDATRCALSFKRVGGFKVDSKWKTKEEDVERLVWIAEVDGVKVPVRLSVSWPLGYATGRIDLR